MLADPQWTRPPERTLINAATTIAAIQAAGFAHVVFGGTHGHFLWPWHGLPIALAAATYAVAHSALTDLAVPLVAGQPINRQWPGSILRDCPHHVIGAGLAVGLIEIIDHELWEVMPVAALPLFFAHRAYCAYVSQIANEHRSHEAIESLDQGVAVLDGRGQITLWNNALEHIVSCSREHALGRSLFEALPLLKTTGLPRTIDEAIERQTSRTQLLYGVLSPAGTRILQVSILPARDTTTLLWRDITDQKRAEYAMKRSEERLALAAEGASDGLWEWDLRSKEFYVSARWRAMMGLSATEAIGRIEDWMDRVHQEEIAPLKEALQAHLSGKTDHFQYEHRLRHESGSYRQYLCRGVAVRNAGKRAIRIAGSLTDTTGRSLAREWVLSAGFLDPLTGLSNRSVFVAKLGRRLDEIKQRRGERFAALYIDLDRFKVVNDSLGHLVGDALLIAVSRRLESCLRRATSSPGLAATSSRSSSTSSATSSRPTPSRSGSRARSAPPSPSVARKCSRRRASASPSAARSTTTPTRSCVTPIPRCITPKRAARHDTSSSTPICTPVCAIGSDSKTISGTPSGATATLRSTTSQSCRCARACASASSRWCGGSATANPFRRRPSFPSPRSSD
jgi:PAS domain S-box-containing protein